MVFAPYFVPMHPMAYDVPMSMRRGCAPHPCAMRSSCGAPNFLFFVALMLLAPTIVKVGLLMMFTVLSLVSSLVHMCIIFCVSAFIARGISHVVDQAATDHKPRTCGDKTSGSCGKKSDSCASKTVRAELNKERRHDLSSVAFENKADELRVIVTVPGLRSGDIDLSFLEGVLHVTGETKRGADVYLVDRRIGLPPQVDADTTKATHADGQLTITMQRKHGKRIPVVHDQVKAHSMASEEPIASKYSETGDVGVEAVEDANEAKPTAATPEPDAASSDEWVPLGRSSES